MTVEPPGPSSASPAVAPVSVLRKGLLLIATPLIFQVLVLGVLLWNERQSWEAESQALHSEQVISHANSALLLLFVDVSRIRGWIITQDPSLLVGPPGSFAKKMERLRELVADNPAQRRRAEAMLANARELEARKGTLDALVAAGKVTEAAAVIRTLEGEHRLQWIRSKVTEFLQEEGRLGLERRQRLQQTRRLQHWLLLGTLLAAAAITFLLARAFARGISSRLEVVAINARRIALNIPLPPPLEGADEIAELDRTLHETTRRLNAAAVAERQHEEDLKGHAEALALINQSLQSKTEEIETFVYSVTHDLRSPLVNLQGFSRELELSCGDLWRILAPVDLSPQIHNLLEAVERDIKESVYFIKASVSSSGRLIDALLRLSRAGRVSYQWQKVDVGEVVQRVLDTLRAKILEKGARVTIGELPPVWGDPTAVEQIFGNLLRNAVSYLDPLRPGTIAVSAESGPPGSLVTFWVRDNGLGIPEAHQSKLFLPFQRFQGNVTPGEGIGLALVRRAVERQGGEIHVESQEGVGTAFTLTLAGGDVEDEACEALP
jgi:signal transduction histidine kinase